MIESVTLNDGKKFPLVGLGTWLAPKGVVGSAVKEAIDLGYRSIDCSPAYENEKEIGEAIHEAFTSGRVKREDLFLTSKLWNTHHEAKHVRGAVQQTLKDLRVDYLDLFLIHFPIAVEFTGYDLTTSVRFPKDEQGHIKFAKAPIHETWREMEKLVDDGLVKSIGISNFTIRETLDLLTYARIRPAVNQIELSPLNTREHLVEVLHQQDIHVTSYSTLGAQCTQAGVTKLPVILELAEKHGRTPAQIALRWCTQRGISVIPKSTNRERLKENLNVFDFSLEDEDLKRISAENTNRSVFENTRSSNWGFDPWA
eukprot:TRINITY_DN5111_c0_g1_i1.p1 TRINITY_DN5111_c0_g1~~TRINITY_DN5111_c0_g1_i1.p1  ORF type:complete len:312 (+),score=55.15 TRINITY_DN5111_c0_g1_i1:463-1398(+)